MHTHTLLVTVSISRPTQLGAQTTLGRCQSPALAPPFARGPCNLCTCTSSAYPSPWRITGPLYRQLRKFQALLSRAERHRTKVEVVNGKQQSITARHSVGQHRHPKCFFQGVLVALVTSKSGGATTDIGRGAPNWRAITTQGVLDEQVASTQQTTQNDKPNQSTAIKRPRPPVASHSVRVATSPVRASDLNAFRLKAFCAAQLDME